MIEKFELQNRTTLTRVKFGQDFDCDYIFKEGDVDWGIAPGQHNSYSYPGQIGVSISNSMIKERDIVISGYAYYVPNNQDKAAFSTHEELKEYVYRKIKEKKVILNELINPLEVVRLYIDDYYIEGMPTQSIRYGQTVEENNEVFCKFLIQLYCNEPGFKKEAMVYENERSIKPMFKFPLIFDNNNPIKMSQRIDYNSLSVINEGTLSIGAKIILNARSEIMNPTIMNSSTGERIRINKTMIPGEVIEITTLNGNEKGIKGIIDGESVNYFKYWNFENDWIRFLPGVNLLSYTTDNEAESFLDVSVEISPEKLALEEM